MRCPSFRTGPAAVLVCSVLIMGWGAHAATQCTPGQMDEARLQLLSAQPLLESQQWAEAIAQLNSIVDFCPEFFPALRGLGRAYQQTGDFERAVQAYARVIEIRGEEAEAADFANLGLAYIRQRKFREARAEFLKARARDAHDCRVLFNLGIAHNFADDPMRAVETLEDALMFCPELEDRILPQLAEAAAKAAAVQQRIGNRERAADFQRKADEYAGSAGGSTAYQQIQASMQRRDYAGTIELCQRLVGAEPDHANAWLTMARAADALDRKKQSVEAYRKYLELRPDNVDETAAMIIVMAEAGLCDEAIAAARAAVQQFTGLGSRALGKINFAYGKALFCAADYAGAKAQFQRAVQSGDEIWVGAAREGVAACDQQFAFEAAQRQRAAQRAN